MSLARWIMDHATDNPPRGREDWAAAMRAEFETLDARRLGWALGCWRTMAGWRLQADWPFLVVLLGIALATPRLLLGEAVGLLFNAMPEDVLRVAFVPTLFALQVLPAGILAAWRPDNYRKAAVIIAAVASVEMVISLHNMTGGWFESGWQYFNAPVIPSVIALFAACWISAATAATLSIAMFHSRRRFSAT